ncbi:MAG TPA: rhomboid family intramembrane serine protease [Steroidobacteraceae bacterium]|nr:rhomboid family intramembrane serine protease [Steroidobacteraceae bacterium]
MADDLARPDEHIGVYRSARQSDCAERSLVLDALGIRSETRFEPPFHALRVDTLDAPRAREQLALYEVERQAPRRVSLPRLPTHAHAWVGCLLYAAVLIGIGLVVANGLWGPLAFDNGAMDATRVATGQWWRAWTALTLHVDGQHLAANLLVGCLFGYLAGRQQGPGHAWLLIVSGAALSNLLEAGLSPAGYRSVGASTAVFTALGLMSAFTWATRSRWAHRRALQWAPLICGGVLLAWFGSGDGAAPGETDVLAHALGFASGVLLGLAVTRPLAQRRLRDVPQWATGALALLQLALAWACALRA